MRILLSPIQLTQSFPTTLLSPIQLTQSFPTTHTMRILLSPIRRVVLSPIQLFSFGRCQTTVDSLNSKLVEFPHLRNTTSCNKLLKGYVKNGQFTEAQQLFEKMPHRDANTWNSLILAYGSAHSPKKACHHFIKMMEGGTRPNGVTFIAIMNAVCKTKLNALVPQLHAQVVRLGLMCDTYLVGGLMRGYIYLGDRRGFSRVFDEVEYLKNVEVYTMLILGYIEFGLIVEAKRVFDLMPTRSAHTWSIMIKGLMDNKMVIEARQVFDSLPTKDVISWTAMITGCTKCGMFVEALELFVEMMRSGMCRPNAHTLSNVLHACSRCSSLAMGKQFHACSLKLGVLSELASANSLIDMYAKAGDIDAAFCVFESMTEKNLVSWSSIIGGCGMNGLAERALEVFRRMLMSHIVPNRISLVNILSACAHGGKVKEAETIFKSMECEYGVKADMDHYSCMVDLYGRAELLEKAEGVIKGMPFEPSKVVWRTLLAACGKYSSLEVGEYAAIELNKLDPDDPALYATLSKIYGEHGARSGVFKLETMIEKWEARKRMAGSWIEGGVPH